MSTGPTRGPFQRPGEDRDFTELFQRVEDLERFPPGRWIYVGSYPADPGTTPDSPPFENGWVNVGGGAQRLRFRRNSDWSLDIEGSVIGGVAGSAGSVVTTLNELYRPSEDVEAPGVGGSWLLASTGELIFYEGGDDNPDCDACAEIAAHIADTVDAHMASAIGYLGSSDLPRDNVQDAIDYLLDLIDAGGDGVTSLSKSGSALLTGAVTLTGGTGVTLTQAGQDISIAASGGSVGIGSSELIYRYTVAGSDKASIDTGVDTPSAGSNVWSGGDLLEVFLLSRTDDAGATATFSILLNNDGATTNYDSENQELVNATFSNGPNLGQASWASLRTHGSGGSASYPASAAITLPNYAGTTFFKNGHGVFSRNDSTAGNVILSTLGLGYRSTSAITRLKVAAAGAAKFKVGTQLLIYKRTSS